ncbi:hypothetical protein Tco_1296314, partial [Tanacetum coccineum]
MIVNSTIRHTFSQFTPLSANSVILSRNASGKSFVSGFSGKVIGSGCMKHKPAYVHSQRAEEIVIE